MLCLSDLLCMYLAWYAQSGGCFRPPSPDADFEGLAGAGLSSWLFVDELFRAPVPGEEDWRDPRDPQWIHTEGILISRGNLRFVRSLTDGRETLICGNTLVEVDAIPEEGFVHLLTSRCFTGWREMVTANDDSFSLMNAFFDNYGKVYCLMDYADLTEEERYPVAALISDPAGAESLFRCLCAVAAELRKPETDFTLEQLVRRHNRHYGSRWQVTEDQIRTLAELSGLEDPNYGRTLQTLLACWDSCWNPLTGEDVFRSGLAKERDFEACFDRVSGRVAY